MRIQNVLLGALAVALSAAGASAQEPSQGQRIDSLAVIGNQRVSRASIISTAEIQPGQIVTYLDIQSAEKALWATGDFQDVHVYAPEERAPAGNRRVVLTFVVKEQPL